MQRRMRCYFQRDEVWYNGALVLTGRDIGPGRLWILLIDGRASLDEEEPAKEAQNPPSIARGNSAYLTVQVAEGKIYASNFLCDATCHGRKSNK